MPKDKYLDPDTNDLTLTAQKDLRFTSNNIEYTIQKIKNVLNFIYGEWYLNTTLGVPYLALNNNDRDNRTKNIFVKNPDLAFINGIFITQISAINTIEEIIDFNSSLNTDTRTFSVSFEVKLIDGDTLQDTVEIGVF